MAKMGWPKLSETLDADRRQSGSLFPFEWGQCQRCGLEGELFDDHEVWREHDETDRAQPVAVVLCSACAEKIVPPHPRLYSIQRKDVPLAGVMELCRDCEHRSEGGYVCEHPDLTVNGGPGLKITFPEPMKAHVNYGRGRGEWLFVWQGPPTECAGREVRLTRPGDGQLPG